MQRDLLTFTFQHPCLSLCDCVCKVDFENFRPTPEENTLLTISHKLSLSQGTVITQTLPSGRDGDECEGAWAGASFHANQHDQPGVDVQESRAVEGSDCIGLDYSRFKLKSSPSNSFKFGS
ncbi:hypothetical protein V2W45_241596 [Cenococcum geophilum]